MPDADLELLRAYEPTLRFTRGELFFPCAVGPYAELCSLRADDEDGSPHELVPTGSLTLDELCRRGREHRDAALHLLFVDQPLGRRDYRRWRREYKTRLADTARLGSVGFLGRFADAGFRLSLTLRGKVPGGQAAAAEVAYREQVAGHGDVYYGRVVREGGYVALQYWFFYAMNDWRSTFSGVNDHEADWEMVTVYLAADGGGGDGDGSLRPAWAAYSSHDYHGDDLRRRWDDPELVREGDHPVVFPGAGSHSGAFIAGDYVSSVSPEGLEPTIQGLQRVGKRVMPWTRDREEVGFGIPFVDYSRGDGVRIGPGTDRLWSAVLIDDDTDWVHDYRGLWGLDTRDPFGGERAPSGPRYERDGSIRGSWANPLGWAGLQKVPPSDAGREEVLREQIAVLEGQLAEADPAIERERAELRRARVRTRSLGTAVDTREAAGDQEKDIARRERELNEAVAQRAQLRQELEVHRATLAAPFPTESPQAHIRRKHAPRVQTQTRRKRFLRVWAAISAPLIIAAFVLLILEPSELSFTTVAVILLVFFGVEAFARRRFLAYLATVVGISLLVTIGSSLAVAFGENWKIALGLVLALAAFSLLVANVRDLRGR